jgi:cellulose synthase/poly-beta-1,6-N-acetylglucosamine synthase-like glycosyltransferase
MAVPQFDIIIYLPNFILMNAYEIIFFLFLFLVFYTYIGYGVLLVIMVNLKKLFVPAVKIKNDIYEPFVTLFVAAYNEEKYILEKVQNLLDLDYPKEKIQLLFVTDGSNDKSVELLKNNPNVLLIHQPERFGKVDAINRGMKYVEHPIVIYSDANAMLNSGAIKEIVKHFKDPLVGCVAGEKRIVSKDTDQASGAGEGIYWKYESLLKQLDYQLFSATGAAGELFSIRTSLHQKVEIDTLLDDFIISMRIVERGFKIAYEPKAYATESSCFSIQEEMKRKIRISAGGLQSIARLYKLLNIFKYGIFSIQYISHRVLRWTITPIALLLLFPLNILLIQQNHNVIYLFSFYFQLLFYSLALLGWYMENRKLKLKFLFIPFYFFFMNYCVFRGFIRFMKNDQTVLWEKALRD